MNLQERKEQVVRERQRPRKLLRICGAEMARSVEEDVFRRFLGDMLADMKTSKPVLVATTFQLYSMKLIAEVYIYICITVVSAEFLLCLVRWMYLIQFVSSLLTGIRILLPAFSASTEVDYPCPKIIKNGGWKCSDKVLYAVYVY